MRRIATIMFVLLVCPIGCLQIGCAAAPKNMNEALMLIDRAAGIARTQGVSYKASLTWDGTASGFYTQRAGLDSGMAMEIHFQGNAQDATGADVAKLKAELDARRSEVLVLDAYIARIEAEATKPDDE